MWKYGEHCCGATCLWNYHLYLEEDVIEALANAARFGVGFGQCWMMSWRASTPL